MVDALKQQHSELQDILIQIKQIASDKTMDGKAIFKIINSFKKMLVKHIELEDNEFYPQLLKKMKKAGMEIGKTLQFVDGMKDIAKDINAFFVEYSTANKIDKNKDKFYSDLETITNSLNIRIEAEEVFVFIDWQYLNNLDENKK